MTVFRFPVRSVPLHPAVRHTHERHVMKKLMLAPLALIALLLGLLAPLAPATAAASAWNDGKSDSDLLWNCVTETYGTGVSANTGWWSPTGQVPKVGEPFMLRGYIGYIGTPCADKVLVVPEVVAPPGLEYIDEPVRWDIAPAGRDPGLPDRRPRLLRRPQRRGARSRWPATSRSCSSGARSWSSSSRCAPRGR